MKIWFVLLALALRMAPAFANDGGGVAIGGTWQPLKGEHNAIRMEREWLRFDAYHGHYEADILFHFRNLTRNGVRVQMGFPESGGGVDVGPDYNTKSAYRGFKTWVNGHPVAAQRLPAKMKPDDEKYSTYWVKTVWFAPLELKVIRVRYGAPYADAMGDGKSIPYGFSGGNWRGKVASSQLTLCLHTPGHWFGPATITYRGQENPTLRSLRKHGSTLSTSWINWEAEGDLSLGLNWMPRENWTALVQGQVLKSSTIAVNYSYNPARWSSPKFWKSLVNVVVPGRPRWRDLDFKNGEIPDFWQQDGGCYVRLATLDRAHIDADWRGQGRVCTLTFYDRPSRTLRAVRLDAGRHSARKLYLPCAEEQIRGTLAAAHWEKAETLPVRGALLLPPFLPQDYRGNQLVPLRTVIEGLGGHVLFEPAARKMGFWFDS